MEMSDDQKVACARARTWLTEEVAEYDAAVEVGSQLEELDAIFDIVGVCALLCSKFSRAQLEDGIEYFINSQVAKGRSVRNDHILEGVRAFARAQSRVPQDVRCSVSMTAINRKLQGG